MSETSPRELLDALSSEHDVLREQIADLRQFWNEVSQLGQGPKYEEMGERVRQLRSVLAGHFASEEQGPYLVLLGDSGSQLMESITQLKSQHAEFLNTLDLIISRLAKCESAYHCWNEVRVDFEDVIQRLDQHEAAEMSLLRQAIPGGNQVVGEE